MFISDMLIQRLSVVKNLITFSTAKLLKFVNNFLVAIKILLRVENLVAFITGDDIFLTGMVVSLVLVQRHFKAKDQLTDVTLVNL